VVNIRSTKTMTEFLAAPLPLRCGFRRDATNESLRTHGTQMPGTIPGIMLLQTVLRQTQAWLATALPSAACAAASRAIGTR
jgi:hypothetical protein